MQLSPGQEEMPLRSVEELDQQLDDKLRGAKVGAAAHASAASFGKAMLLVQLFPGGIGLGIISPKWETML